MEGARDVVMSSIEEVFHSATAAVIGPWKAVSVFNSTISQDTQSKHV